MSTTTATARATITATTAATPTATTTAAARAAVFPPSTLHACPRHRWQQRGTSMVEALIVLGVTGVLLGSALPGLSELRERQRVKSLAAQLQTDLHHARSLAVERNQVLRISYGQGLAQGGCYVLHTGAAQQCHCDGSSPTPVCTGEALALRSFTLAPDSRVRMVSNVSAMAFEPQRGTVTPTGTVRVLDAQGRGQHLVVNIMGRVRQCAPAGSPTGPGLPAC